MKILRVLTLLAVPFCFDSCSSVELASTDLPPIEVAEATNRVCGQGEIVFPAGVYQAEVTSAQGTYYKAPKRIRTLGVLIGRSEEGGIFVSNSAGNPQAAWFGDPKDNVDERPSTLFGAIGWSAPKLWPYKPRVPYTVKK